MEFYALDLLDVCVLTDFQNSLSKINFHNINGIPQESSLRVLFVFIICNIHIQNLTIISSKYRRQHQTINNYSFNRLTHNSKTTTPCNIEEKRLLLRN